MKKSQIMKFQMNTIFLKKEKEILDNFPKGNFFYSHRKFYNFSSMTQFYIIQQQIFLFFSIILNEKLFKFNFLNDFSFLFLKLIFLYFFFFLFLLENFLLARFYSSEDALKLNSIKKNKFFVQAWKTFDENSIRFSLLDNISEFSLETFKGFFCRRFETFNLCKKN